MTRSTSASSDRSAARQVGILFGPVAAAVLLGRLVEFGVTTAAFYDSGGGLAGIVQVAIPILLVLGVAGGIWAVLVRAGRRPAEAVGASAVVAAVFAVATRAALPPWLKPWMSEALVESLRTDLLVVLALAIAFGVALSTAGPRRRPAVLLAGRLVAGLLFLILLADTAYLATVGAPLDGQLLRYTISNAADLMPVIATEVRWEALLLPLAIAAVLATSLRWARAARERPWPMPVQTLALCAAAAAGLAMTPGTQQGLTVRLLSEETSDPGQLGAAAWVDTRALRLVPTARARRLNVLVVVMESTRRRSTTMYTPGLATTPFLDSLARQGALVERMTTTVPQTNKSLVSIFGGVYPYPHPEWAPDGATALPVHGLPSLLRDVGYGTAFFSPSVFQFEGQDKILASVGFETTYGEPDIPPGRFMRKEYMGYEDRAVLQPALGWIDRQTAARRPFMLGMITFTAHHPYDTPPGWPLHRFDPDPELNRYLNAIHYEDAFLRDLWGGIRQRGLADSTVLVLVGDHGEGFGEHGHRTHADAVWDEILEVPGIVVAPGIAPGTRVAGERSTLDILPTVADVLGYRLAGADLPGSSLLRPVAEGRVLYHYSRASDIAGAIRRGPHKTMTWWGRRPSQAFDLAADPGERAPLSGQAEQIRQDEREFHRWRAAAVAFYRGAALRPEAAPRGR